MPDANAITEGGRGWLLPCIGWLHCCRGAACFEEGGREAERGGGGGSDDDGYCFDMGEEM